jgi:hypothetical protein
VRAVVYPPAVRTLLWCLVVLAVASGHARAQCDGPIAPELNSAGERFPVTDFENGIHSSLVVEAPIGGVWVTDLRLETLLPEEDKSQCGEVQFVRIGGDAAEANLDVVRDGILMTMLRVPEDATDGVDFVPRVVCGLTTGNGPSLRGSGAAIDRPAPVIVEVATEVIPPAPFGGTCDDTPDLLPEPQAHFGDHSTHIRLTVDTEASELLVDAALGLRGGGVADAAPFLEMFARPVEDGVVSLDVAVPGAHDVHIVLTDFATGLASEPVVVEVDTPQPSLIGCSCATSSRADALTLCVLIGLLRRRPSLHTRKAEVERS